MITKGVPPEDVRKGGVSAGDASKAREKVIRASTELRKSEIQRAERKERRRKYTTRELWCTMREAALTDGDWAGGAAVGGQSRRTMEDDSRELRQRGRPVGQGRIRVRLAYRLSELGRDLFEAGHITSAS